MKFNKINHIVVFGGSQLTLEFLKLLKKKKINYHYFTNKRQLLDNLSNNLNLRDNLKNDFDSLCFKKNAFALVDEVDSILIDEARTPLVISAEAKTNLDLFSKINKIIKCN